MRPSYETLLPSWLSKVPEVPPTPIVPSRPRETTVLRRAIRSSRLPLHVVVFAILLGVGAAAAAGTVRAQQTAESRAQMSTYAAAKIAELRAFGTLRSAPARALGSPIASGGSLTDDVPGYFDVVEGTEGRRYHRRWMVDADPAGHKRVVVRVTPATRGTGQVSLDLTAVLAHR